MNEELIENSQAHSKSPTISATTTKNQQMPSSLQNPSPPSQFQPRPTPPYGGMGGGQGLPRQPHFFHSPFGEDDPFFRDSEKMFRDFDNSSPFRRSFIAGRRERPQNRRIFDHDDPFFDRLPHEDADFGMHFPYRSPSAFFHRPITTTRFNEGGSDEEMEQQNPPHYSRESAPVHNINVKKQQGPHHHQTEQQEQSNQQKTFDNGIPHGGLHRSNTQPPIPSQHQHHNNYLPHHRQNFQQHRPDALFEGDESSSPTNFQPNNRPQLRRSSQSVSPSSALSDNSGIGGADASSMTYVDGGTRVGSVRVVPVRISGHSHQQQQQQQNDQQAVPIIAGDASTLPLSSSLPPTFRDGGAENSNRPPPSVAAAAVRGGGGLRRTNITVANPPTITTTTTTTTDIAGDGCTSGNDFAEGREHQSQKPQQKSKVCFADANDYEPSPSRSRYANRSQSSDSGGLNPDKRMRFENNQNFYDHHQGLPNPPVIITVEDFSDKASNGGENNAQTNSIQDRRSRQQNQNAGEKNTNQNAISESAIPLPPPPSALSSEGQQQNRHPEDSPSSVPGPLPPIPLPPPENMKTTVFLSGSPTPSDSLAYGININHKNESIKNDNKNNKIYSKEENCDPNGAGEDNYSSKNKYNRISQVSDKNCPSMDNRNREIDPGNGHTENPISNTGDETEIGSNSENLIKVLDQTEIRVEKLREAATQMEQEKARILKALDGILASGQDFMNRGEFDEMNLAIERILKRCNSVTVNVKTPRNLEQDKALEEVNGIISAATNGIEGIFDVRAPVLKPDSCERLNKTKNELERFFNACRPDEPPGPIDQRFQSKIVACTADDQKRMRKRLMEMIAQIESALIKLRK